MFVINDNDLPITVAYKIITGVKPYKATSFEKAFVKAITGDEATTRDMFSIEEIAEIAAYLNDYLSSHPKGD